MLFPLPFIFVMRIERNARGAKVIVCHLLRYPRKKFWLGKPIARVVKKKTGEFSDKLLSLQRGLREFQGKGWGKPWGGGQEWDWHSEEGSLSPYCPILLSQSSESLCM